MSMIIDLNDIVKKDVKNTMKILEVIKNYQDKHPNHVVRVGIKLDKNGKLLIVPISELK